MDWTTFWAKFSQTHLVTLLVTESKLEEPEFSGRFFYFAPRGKMVPQEMKLALRGKLCLLGQKLSPRDEGPLFAPPFFYVNSVHP
jgi:hypothetical protein